MSAESVSRLASVRAEQRGVVSADARTDDLRTASEATPRPRGVSVSWLPPPSPQRKVRAKRPTFWRQPRRAGGEGPGGSASPPLPISKENLWKAGIRRLSSQCLCTTPSVFLNTRSRITKAKHRPTLASTLATRPHGHVDSPEFHPRLMTIAAHAGVRLVQDAQTRRQAVRHRACAARAQAGRGSAHRGWPQGRPSSPCGVLHSGGKTRVSGEPCD